MKRGETSSWRKSFKSNPKKTINGNKSHDKSFDYNKIADYLEKREIDITERHRNGDDIFRSW